MGDQASHSNICNEQQFERRLQLSPTWRDLAVQDVCEGLETWEDEADANPSIALSSLPTNIIAASVRRAADDLRSIEQALRKTLQAIARCLALADESATGLDWPLSVAFLCTQVLGLPKITPVNSTHARHQHVLAAEAEKCLLKTLQYVLHSPVTLHSVDLYLSIGQALSQLILQQLSAQTRSSQTDSSLVDLFLALVLTVDDSDRPTDDAAMHSHHQHAWRPWSWYCFRDALQQMVSAAHTPVTTTSKQVNHMTSIVAYLTSVLRTACQRHGGMWLLLASAELMHSADAALSLHKASIAPPLPPLKAAEGEVLLQVVSAAVHAIQDACLAGLVLKCALSVSDPTAAARKLVLDLAALAGACQERHIVGAAATAMQRGSMDKDATVRSKALTAFRTSLAHIWMSDLAQHGCTPTLSGVQRSSTGGQGFVVNSSVVLEVLLPVMSSRLLDTTKTVRTKTLQLLSDVLAWRPTQAWCSGSDASALNHGTVCQRFKKVVARSTFPWLCCLVDARPDSTLYDEGCLQLLPQVMQAVLRAMGESEVLQLLLYRISYTDNRSMTFGNERWGGGQQLEQNAVDTCATSSHMLSQGLLHSLLCQCQPDTALAYDIWAQHIANLKTTDQIHALARLAGSLPQSVVLHQHAMHELCVVLAQDWMAAVGQEQSAQLIRKATSAVQVVFCMSGSGDSPITSTSLHHAAPAPSGAGAQPSSNQHSRSVTTDLVCEVACFLDLARLLHQTIPAPPSAPNSAAADNEDKQRYPTDMTDLSDATPPYPAIPAPPSSEVLLMHACLAWSFRATRSLLLRAGYQANTKSNTPTGASEPMPTTTALAPGGKKALTQIARVAPPPPPAPAAVVAVLDSAGRVVLRSLQRMIASGLLSRHCIAVADAALDLLCSCRPVAAAWRLANHVLHQLETDPGRQQQPPAPACTLDLPTCEAAVGLKSGGSSATGGAADVSLGGQVRQMSLLLLLLNHMTQLYDAEVNDVVVNAMAQAPAGTQGARPGINTGQLTVDGTSSAAAGGCPEPSTDHDGGAVPGGYLAQEEHVNAVNIMTQVYLGEVMSRTAPGNRVHVLVELASHSQGLPGSCLALVVRALGRLMALSPTLACAHQQLLAQHMTALLRTLEASPLNGTATLISPPSASSASYEDITLVTDEALIAVRTLLIRHPNVNSSLIRPLEELVAGLLTAVQGANMLAVARLCCERVLHNAMTALTEVLSCEKLQLTGDVWRLLASCAVSKQTKVKKLARQVLCTLVAQQQQQQQQQQRAPSAGKPSTIHINNNNNNNNRFGNGKSLNTADALCGQSAANTKYTPLLALYGNCPAIDRLQLVEDVILGSSDDGGGFGGGLVTSQDLCDERLVLAVLQSLYLADSQPARRAALALLQRMTLSQRAVSSLSDRIQAQQLGLGRLGRSESQAILSVLLALVARNQAT